MEKGGAGGNHARHHLLAEVGGHSESRIVYSREDRLLLFSTLLMLSIPARIARCKEIVVCTPHSDAAWKITSLLFYMPLPWPE